MFLLQDPFIYIGKNIFNNCYTQSICPESLDMQTVLELTGSTPPSAILPSKRAVSLLSTFEDFCLGLTFSHGSRDLKRFGREEK